MIIPDAGRGRVSPLSKLAATLLLASLTAAAYHWQWKSRFAPEGTLFLLEPGMVRTENGVTGFPAGTHVRIVADEGTYIAVSREELEFRVPRAKLTNRVAAAEAAAAADQEAQRVAARLVLQQHEKSRESYQRSADLQERRQREIASSRPLSLASGALNRSAYAEKHRVARAPVVYWAPAR